MVILAKELRAYKTRVENITVGHTEDANKTGLNVDREFIAGILTAHQKLTSDKRLILTVNVTPPDSAYGVGLGYVGSVDDAPMDTYLAIRDFIDDAFDDHTQQIKVVIPPNVRRKQEAKTFLDCTYRQAGYLMVAPDGSLTGENFGIHPSTIERIEINEIGNTTPNRVQVITVR